MPFNAFDNWSDQYQTRAMSAVDLCTDALETSILRQEVRAGERLPPERDLAERFGVGRATIRGALGRLATRGLLEVRQGSGYAVRDFRRVGGLELLPKLARLAETQSELLRELLRLRRHLAAALVEALAARPGRDLGAAQRALDAFAAIPAADVDALAEADLEVIGALLEASGSTPLQLCFNPLHGVVRAMPRLRAAIYAEPASNVAAYRALLDALEAGEPPDAVALHQLLRARDAHTLTTLGLPETP